MDVVKIVITVEVPAGCRVDVAAEAPRAADVGGAAGKPAAAVNSSPEAGTGSLGASCDTDGLAELGAYATLLEAGVDHPDKVLETFTAGRVLDVCTAAEKAGGRVKDKAAWIMAALRKGYTV